VPDPVAAQIEVQVRLGPLTPDRFLTAGAALPAAFTRPDAGSGNSALPGSSSASTGTVAGTPITPSHVRDLLAQVDAAGLHTPTGGSLHFAFTDDTGALRAVATLPELRRAAKRGCPAPPAGDCGCPVISRPEPTHT